MVDVVRNLYGSAGAIENAERKLRKLRTLAGVKSNILSLRIKGKLYYLVNIRAAESRASGLNYPEEVSRLMKNSVLLKMNNGVLFLKK
jgi:flagellin-like hook-associated protein FlgL